MTLDNLKPGDEVFFYSRFDLVPLTRNVERVLESHVVVLGVKFRKRDGHAVGGSNASIKLITPETMVARDKAVAERNRRQLVNTLHYKINWFDYPLDVLTKVAELIGVKVEP